MHTLLWLLALVSALCGAIWIPFALSGATGAPQEASIVAFGIALAVVPYCIARAWDEILERPTARSQAGAAEGSTSGGTKVKRALQVGGVLVGLWVLVAAWGGFNPEWGRTTSSADAPPSQKGSDADPGAATPADAPISDPAPPNPWSVHRSASPIDDTETVSLAADADTESRYGTPTIIIRCRDNKTEAYITTARTVDIPYDRNSASLRVRLDSQSPKRVTFGPSTDRKALFAMKAIPFVKSLLGHEKLVLEYTPLGGGPTSIEFRIAGLDQKIEIIQNACGWK